MKIETNIDNLKNYKIYLKIEQAVNEFLKKKGYLKVDLPVLSPALIPESYLEVFETEFRYLDKRQKLYLTPSPELFLKRLLVAGIGNCYYLGRSFRNSEPSSSWHQPEFTMLEFYKIGVNYLELANEILEMLRFISVRLSFRAKSRNLKKISPLTSFGRNDIDKAILFNSGRIASYSAFGFLAGLVGQALITNLKFGPFLTLLAAVFMILLGLDMAKIVSLGTIIPSGLNKAIFEKLEHKLMKYPRKAPFFLGAITYFLPCGFTQAVQVYALGLASPLQSALTMMIFALGTMPALLLIGVMSTFTKSTFYSYFIKTMGVLVFVIGFFYLSNFTSLYGININPFSKNGNSGGMSASLENGVQTINMKVVTSGYIPNYFTVKNGIPVKWKIQGENVFGCQAYFVVPKLGVQKTLEQGENLIKFTPTETGFINFSCGMGMYRGRIEVID